MLPFFIPSLSAGEHDDEEEQDAPLKQVRSHLPGVLVAHTHKCTAQPKKVTVKDMLKKTVLEGSSSEDEESEDEGRSSLRKKTKFTPAEEQAQLRAAFLRQTRQDEGEEVRLCLLCAFC